jgi:SAM-dependent methyltransferase
VSAESLQFAEAKAFEAGVTLAGCVQVDAADIRCFTSASFDAVLMLGPLYHLLEESRRRRAVAEGARILRNGGSVFAAFITRAAVLRYCALERPEWILKHGEQLLATGLPAESFEEGSFPAYFSHPAEVVPLMESGGFETMDLVGCEGVVSMIEERINELSGELWQAWVDINYRLGHNPTLYGASNHLLYIGRKAWLSS